MRLLACFFLVALATLFGDAIRQGPFLWIAPGMLLAYLLLAPRKSWPGYIVAALLAHIAVTPWMHPDWSVRLLFAPHDALEAALAALLLRRRSTELPIFINGFYLLRFAACALLLVPLAVSFVYAAIMTSLHHSALATVWAQFYVAESLGLLVTTPAFVAAFRTHFRLSSIDQRSWLIIVPAIGIVALLLSQNSTVFLPLLFPLVVYVLLRRGLGWASLVTLCAFLCASWYTSHGIGPFAPSSPHAPSAAIGLQIYVIAIMVVLYSVSVIVENLRKTEHRLQQIANLHATVAENSRDVIMLFDFQGGRSFISAPDRFWGGWSRNEILETKTFELVHDDDRKRIAPLMDELKTSTEGTMIELRVRRKDSTYGWLEASLRTVRDPISHLPTGVLANIREVTERKNAEQRLEDAFHAVEALSVTDPLTALANRRRFDESLATEWRRALREQNPLSLLLLDADHFKSYNDTYGHPSGDTCLQQISDAVRSGATRSTDLAARIGGEEFAVLLPNTSGPGARRLANRICENLRARTIPHEGSPLGIVTISIGSATVIPQPGQVSSFLVDLADQALYTAKRAGRNRVYPPVSGHEQGAIESANAGHA